MKRFFICIFAICAIGASANAQSWLDALKKVATDAVDNITGGKLTEVAIVGSWSYSAPALRLGSDDNALAALGGQAISSTVGQKLAPLLEGIGVKEGFCTITFNSDGTFALPIKGRTISGKYTFDSATHAIKLTIGKLGTEINGFAYISGESLQLMFNVDKFKDLIVSLGSNIDALSSITSIIEQYDDINLGLEFKR